MTEEERFRLTEAILEVMKETRHYLDGLALIPRNRDADIVLLALLSKSIVTTEAVTSLVLSGFDDEAYGLCRTCLEIQLTVRYLTNKEADARCSRFLKFFTRNKSDWFDLIEKYYPSMRPAKLKATVYRDLARAYRDPHRWAEDRKGLKSFASEPDSFEKRNDGSPLDANFYYEVLYKWTSFYVHGTISALEDEHITINGDLFSVHPRRGKSTHGEDALRISMLSVHLNLLRIFRDFNMEYPDSLSSKFENAAKEFPAESKK
jgi:hypothetical protein